MYCANRSNQYDHQILLKRKEIILSRSDIRKHFANLDNNRATSNQNAHVNRTTRVSLILDRDRYFNL